VPLLTAATPWAASLVSVEMDSQEMDSPAPVNLTVFQMSPFEL